MQNNESEVKSNIKGKIANFVKVIIWIALLAGGFWLVEEWIKDSDNDKWEKAKKSCERSNLSESQEERCIDEVMSEF